MRNILFVLLICSIIGCSFVNKKQTNFSISGTIKGAKDGMIVKLKPSDSDLMAAIFAPCIDSTVIKDGKFEFSGSLNYPKILSISIENSEDQEGNTYHPVIPIFMGNESVKINGVLDSLPSQLSFLEPVGYNYDKVEIQGSTIHQIYLSYLNGDRKYTQAIDENFDKMFKWYGYKNDGTKGKKGSVFEGIEIAEERNTIMMQRKKYLQQFIEENITNMVGLHVAYNSIGGFSASQIKEFRNSIPKEIQEGEFGKKLMKHAAEYEGVATGAKFVDLEFKDNEGGKVKLSDFAGKGKYVLLEVWASWCSPCRADIPHLKEVYELYHPEGFEILSVSLDVDNSKWLKALEKEQMNWLQVCNGDGFEGEFAKVYKIAGVPTCILIDPEGKIITRNMRGSEMDRRLIEMYAINISVFGDGCMNLSYLTRNGKMLELINTAIDENKGSRILVLIGAEHKHYFDIELSKKDILKVIDFKNILPLKEEKVSENISDFIEKKLARGYYDASDSSTIDLMYTGALIELIHGMGMDGDPNIIPAENTEKAKPIIEEWEKQNPKSAYLQFEKAWVEFLEGDYKQAVKSYNSIANKLDGIPESSHSFVKPFYYRNLGFCYDMLGKRDDAIACYQMCKQICEEIEFSESYAKTIYKNYDKEPYRRQMKQ